MLAYNSNTPILFVIFNRLDTAQKVFNKIKSVKPERLYIAADGPRNEKEVSACNNVKNAILAQIDWDCSVKTLFRTENLGCKKSVSGAVSWFFENEPEGIILEDDCLPAYSFFGFCSLLLEKYRYDERIGHISGSNIGCASPEAAHLDVNNPASNRVLEEMEELHAPSFIIPDIVADITAQKFEFSLPTLKESAMDSFLFIKEKLTECANRSRNKEKDSKIPRIIHQVWDSSDDLPNAIKETTKTWKDFHPDWEYRLWNKVMIAEFLNIHFPDFIPYYKAYPHDMQRRFAIRYLILYHYGGLFVDMDCECLEPLDTLLGDSTCCMGMESGANSMYFNKPIAVGNAFMASIPRHNYFEKIIDDMKINNKKIFSSHNICQIMESTGPFLTTRIHSAYPGKDEITLIPAELIMPLTLNEIKMLLSGNGTREIEDKIEKAFVLQYFLNF